MAGLPWVKRQFGIFISFWRIEMVHKRAGFSLFELLVVIAIIAVVSTIVAPHIISWRSSAKLRGAADNLMSDLEMAKIRAVKENNFVAILFNPAGYRVFVDKTNFWTQDADEPIIKERQLPAGVSFDFAHPNWGFTNNRTRFNSRGRADTDNGTAVVINSSGEQRNVIVSTLGRIRVQRIN
jgi:type IV fimbrial biogenesis protein FimT